MELNFLLLYAILKCNMYLRGIKMARQEDWLRVILVKESNEEEAMPVSFIADKGEYCIGLLEMEP